MFKQEDFFERFHIWWIVLDVPLKSISYMHIPKCKCNSTVTHAYKIEQYMWEILHTQMYVELHSYLQLHFFDCHPINLEGICWWRAGGKQRSSVLFSLGCLGCRWLAGHWQILGSGPGNACTRLGQGKGSVQALCPVSVPKGPGQEAPVGASTSNGSPGPTIAQFPAMRFLLTQ